MMSRNFIPEQILIDRLLFDDAAALEELSRRYCFSLYSYCMSKLNSDEDSKRIVRNIFIALWEDRCSLPGNFSLSFHLYTEVRKGVVQCLNAKLKTSEGIPAIEEQIIPGFSAIQLLEANQPIKHSFKIQSRYHTPAVQKEGYEEQWPNKNSQAISLKGLKHALQNMINLW